MTLKQRLQSPEVLLAPGVFNAWSGMLAERAGFGAVYLSGASIAYTRLGRPDIGLVTASEVCDVLATLRERIRLPILVDADTGFGNALNVQRTVREFERAGGGDEPGRGMVADSFAYAVQVKSVRAGRVYLNDGVYGGLAEFPSMVISLHTVVGHMGEARSATRQPMTVFGPTCDSIDQLPGTLELPVDLSEGDWILFRSMGAYLTGMTTRFNGYGDWHTVTVQSLWP